MARGVLFKKVHFPELYVEKDNSVIERLDKFNELQSQVLRKTMIPLKLLNLSTEEIWAFLDGKKLRGRSRSTLIFKNNTTPQIAQLLGFIITDGSLSSTEGRIKLCQRESELTREYLDIINREYDSKFIHNFNGKETHVGSIPLRYILHKYYGIPLGKKVRTVEVPKQIINSNNEDVLKSFIAGLFDGDGYVQYYYLENKNLDHVNFCISTSSHKLVEESINILDRLGIKCSKLVRKDDKRMTLQTSGFSNSLIFYQKVIPLIFHRKRRQTAEKVFSSQDFIGKLMVPLNGLLKELFKRIIKNGLNNKLLELDLKNKYIKSNRSIEAWTYPSNKGNMRSIYVYKACELLKVNPDLYLPENQLNLIKKTKWS
ncbi:MAG: LAGLIDADG family homing endonuclease [Nanoarchaeota archaeon]